MQSRKRFWLLKKLPKLTNCLPRRLLTMLISKRAIPRIQILWEKIIEVSYQVKEEEVNKDFTESVDIEPNEEVPDKVNVEKGAAEKVELEKSKGPNKIPIDFVCPMKQLCSNSATALS
jgi:hypothetical protein